MIALLIYVWAALSVGSVLFVFAIVEEEYLELPDYILLLALSAFWPVILPFLIFDVVNGNVKKEKK